MSRAKVGFWLFRTKDKNGKLHPRWRIRYTGPDGRLVKTTGFTDKGETTRLAQQLALAADEIRRGVRKPPQPADTESLRPIREHVEAYLAWGCTQGGRGGRPWSATHQKGVKREMDWWLASLKAATLRDITLGAAEKALQEKGAAGKTLSNIAMVLRGFVTWCLKRKYLYLDPLEGLRKFDTTVLPQNYRRPLTIEQIRTLLTTTPMPRCLIYLTVFLTGFRENEIASLRVGNLDVAKRALFLDASDAKDRLEFPAALPMSFIEALQQHAAGRPDQERMFPKFNKAHAARRLARDLEIAGIPKRTFQGKIDFHALRTTFVNVGLDLGFDPKTVQALARHKTPQLTMNTYGRAKPDRLRAAVETINTAIGISPKEVQQSQMALAAGAEHRAELLEPEKEDSEKGDKWRVGSSPVTLAMPIPQSFVVRKGVRDAHLLQDF